jgi:hypothetical protein
VALNADERRMVNIPYRISVLLGKRNRRRFAGGVSSIEPVTSPRQIPVTVYSFSGERDWPEQAASIRSFLRFVGLPVKYVVVSDGSLTIETRRVLEGLNSRVTVSSLSDICRADLPKRVYEYGAAHFLGKKLALLLSLPVSTATIYCDSDVLFFPGAHALARLVDSPLASPLYLLDSWPSLDSRLVICESEKELPVNGGFLIMDRPLEWTNALGRLAAMEGECAFFTEQTLVHLAMKASGGRPLPADQYILRAEDQFSFFDRYARPGIVLRHYISSIRTKFWSQTRVFS